MKPAPFAYVRAETLDHAQELLAQYGADAKILAGGQSLVPALNMRLATPAVLIDINGLEALGGIEPSAEGLRVGALARHAQLEQCALAAAAAPLLSQAIAHVAHPAVRNRGTFGGSIALADPAAELPACCLALDAHFIAAGPQGERRIRARDCFVDLFETALAPDEILLEARLPRLEPNEHCAFMEIARRHGDYAAAGVAVKARIVEGLAAELRLAFFAVDRIPKLAARAAACLSGRTIDADALAQAKAALREDLEPMADVYHGAQTKLHLAGVALERALQALPLRRA